MLKKYYDFIVESISKPQLKYPVDKCFDFLKFTIEMNKDGLDIRNINIDGEKENGNFLDIFKNNQIYPELTLWQVIDNGERKKSESLNIKHIPLIYGEIQSIYELPIKYDSKNDFADWVRSKLEFKKNMKQMKEMRGGVWSEKDEKRLDDNVNYGFQNFNWYNTVLSKLHEKYPQYYENDKIKVWYDKYEFDNGKQIYDYPFDKSYFLSDIEKWLEDTFDINTDGFYKWILDNQYVEGRYWYNVWVYDIDDVVGDKIPNENIFTINEILRQIFKVGKIPIYIDYYEKYK